MYRWLRAKAKSPLGLLAITLIVANELRGLAVAAGVVWTFLHNGGLAHLSLQILAA
jgi:hypothetical protein